MNENTPESLELTEKDEADLEQLWKDGEMPNFHPLLKVWREVLAPARALKGSEKVTPNYAAKMAHTYADVHIRDARRIQQLYYDKLLVLADILDYEISTDDECLNVTTPAEDIEQNTHHYKNLLRDWQLAFLSWELEWDCETEDAAIQLAAISEVHKMIFGDMGIIAHLDQIGFEFTEADQAELAEALGEFQVDTDEARAARLQAVSGE